MPTPIITRPSEKAVFLTATFGVALAVLALFLVPSPQPSQADGGEAAAGGNRPTSGPVNRAATSQPVRAATTGSGGSANTENDGASLSPADFPVEAYGDLLDAYLADGRVDYEGLSTRGRTDLRKLVDAIADTDPGELERLRDDAYAAWHINAYNILTLETIVQNHPVESIMDIDKPWDTPMRVAQRDMTLNQIEHDVLRRQNAPDAERRAFVDPRVHFAVNCASIGCPVLQPEPFTAGNLDESYDRGVRDFMSVERNMRFEGTTWHLSKLMDWYGKDFQLHHGGDGASKSEALGAFFALYEEDPARAELLRSGDFRLRWLDYDWALNGQ